jgi:hypothetical protein
MKEYKKEMSDQDVSDLLANLSIKNDLDIVQDNVKVESDDEEEEAIQSVEVTEDHQDQAEDEEYLSKGPVFRGHTHQGQRHVPYDHLAKPLVQLSTSQEDNSSNIGRFLDDETEVDFIMSRLEQPLNIPEIKRAEDKSGAGIPHLPETSTDSQLGQLKILVQNIDADYQVMENVKTKITLDTQFRKIGIWIPETVSKGNMADKSKQNCTCNGPMQQLI